MLCPQCQTPLTASKYRSIEISSCSTCHGNWLEKESMEALIAQIKPIDSVEKPKKEQPNALETESEEDRKHPHFLSGAFDEW